MVGSYSSLVYLSGFALAQTQLSPTDSYLEALAQGDDFVLAAGDYEIPASLVVTSSTRLLGAGKNETRPLLKGEFTGMVVSGNIHFALKDLTLEYVFLKLKVVADNDSFKAFWIT